MTTLLEKVSTLVSANLHALVDQALKSNSLAVVDQYLRQVDDNLAGLEDAAATVGAEVRSVQRKLDEHQQRVTGLDQAVDAFLAQGNESSAAAAQGRLNSTRRLMQAYEQQLGRHQAEYQNLLDARQKLQARQAAMRAQRAELASLLELARSKELVVKTMRGLDDLVGEGDSDVGRLAQSIYARLDKATVATELYGVSIDQQIDQLLDRQLIDSQLAERRARLLPAGQS
jgi:phage shock protein A